MRPLTPPSLFARSKRAFAPSPTPGQLLVVLIAPIEISLDNLGDIFVTDPGDNALQKLSSDGKLLATGGSSTFPHGPGEIKLWDVDTRILRSSFLTGTLGRCRYLTFTPDGDTLVGICHRADGSVLKFWDVKTLSESRSLDVDNTGDWISFSPDGNSFAIGGQSSIASLWDTATFRKRCELKGHRDCVYHGTISPDGRTLATAGWDGVVKLWHVPTGQEMATLQAAEGNVWSVAFSPDGLSLAAGLQNGDAGAVVLWHASSGRPPLEEGNSTD